MTRRLAVQEPSALCEGFDDLLAVHGNPLVEIGDIHRMAAVFRGGVRVR